MNPFDKPSPPEPFIAPAIGVSRSIYPSQVLPFNELWEYYRKLLAASKNENSG